MDKENIKKMIYTIDIYERALLDIKASMDINETYSIAKEAIEKVRDQDNEDL